MTGYADPVVWGVIVAIGGLTYCIRISFIALFGRLGEVPDRVERLLRFVPAAVLAALTAPALVTVGATGGPALDRLVAGGLAAAVAWRTENVLATMAVGMGALWAVRLVV